MAPIDKIQQELFEFRLQHERFKAHFESETGNVTKKIDALYKLHEVIQGILLRLSTIEGQTGRIVSDAESEKETRKTRNDGFDKRIRTLEDKSSVQEGKNKITDRLLIIVSSVIVGLILWLITKK